MIKAGLDFGNSKISCIVADYKNSEKINILSLHSIPTTNIKKNIILNYENLFEQLKILTTSRQSSFLSYFDVTESTSAASVESSWAIATQEPENARQAAEALAGTPINPEDRGPVQAPKTDRCLDRDFVLWLFRDARAIPWCNFEVANMQRNLARANRRACILWTHLQVSGSVARDKDGWLIAGAGVTSLVNILFSIFRG